MKNKTTDRTISLVIIAVFLLAMLFLMSCADPRQEEREQQTSNSAATIYEAAIAIEHGAKSGPPLQAIKSNASAIATANGHPYPPRDSAKGNAP